MENEWRDTRTRLKMGEGEALPKFSILNSQFSNNLEIYI